MVVWSPRAILDMRETWDYIAVDSESAADRTLASIQRPGEGLDKFPNLGRKGRQSKTRELVVTGTPYIIIYKVTNVGADISRVIHGARNWPP